MKPIKMITMALFAYLTMMAVMTAQKAHAVDADEPAISNYQGSDPTTSVVVLEWPDGVVEKLLYKNKDQYTDQFDKNLHEWFQDRKEAYLKRQGK